jgi:Domain of unknown function (DUF222)
MDSNTHSTPPTSRPAAGRPDWRASVGAADQGLAAEDLDQLSDVALDEDTARLRRQLDGLEGQWLRRVAALDARRAAGASQAQPAPSTASWLRRRLRMGAGAAHSAVRTARALFRGPLEGTGQALLNGDLSPAHARVLADATHALPAPVVAEAEPVLVAAAGRLDPPVLRQAVGWLVQVADPDRADQVAERRHQRRGVWLSPTWEGLVAVDGLLEPEAGQLLATALEPLARPATAEDPRSGGSGPRMR